MIPYTLIRSRRKTLAIQITPAGEVLLRCPSRMSRKAAEEFLQSRQGWVEKQLAAIQVRPQLPPLTEEEHNCLIQKARAIFPQKAARFGAILGVSHGTVTIRTQRTRWGSCSGKGNLSFNCLLLLAPEAVQDYVVIHELCHRTHMDHSPRFWAEVAKFCPDYLRHRAWLKENGAALLGRIPARN